MLTAVLLLTVALGVALCATTPSAALTPLVFHAGFDGEVTLAGDDKSMSLAGPDGSGDPDANWTRLAEHPRVGFVIIGTKANPHQQPLISLAPDPADPDDPERRVLRYFADRPNDNTSGIKTRVALNMMALDRVDRFCHRQRMYLGEDLAKLRERPERIDWLTLAEYWGQGNWDPSFEYPFRITVNLCKDEGAGKPLYLRVHGQTLKAHVPRDQHGRWTSIWEHEARDVEPPIGQWVTTEMFVRDGDAQTGRFVMALTTAGTPRQTLFDVTDWTRHPEDPDDAGFHGVSPMKMYTSAALTDWLREAGGALSVCWDDFHFTTEADGLPDAPPDMP